LDFENTILILQTIFEKMKIFFSFFAMKSAIDTYETYKKKNKKKEEHKQKIQFSFSFDIITKNCEPLSALQCEKKIEELTASMYCITYIAS